MHSIMNCKVIGIEGLFIGSLRDCKKKGKNDWWKAVNPHSKVSSDH